MMNGLIPIDRQKHSELQVSLIKSRILKRIFYKVKHPDHKPDEEELSEFWTSWPGKKFNFSSVFGFFVRMKPIRGADKAPSKTVH